MAIGKWMQKKPPARYLSKTVRWRMKGGYNERKRKRDSKRRQKAPSAANARVMRHRRPRGAGRERAAGGRDSKAEKRTQ